MGGGPAGAATHAGARRQPLSAAAHNAAEVAARASYGRLLSALVARTRDIAGAEDALSDAFLAALRTWPAQGVPAHPEAWLLAVVRNRGLNELRRQAVHAAFAAESAWSCTADDEDVAASIPDERLRLMFVCAHPAMDPAIRTPLMLQTVLGLDAAAIARAFLVEPATMGQRLVRAKARVRDAGLRFELPEADDMAARLQDVLDAVYAAYGSSWETPADGGDASPELTAEALFLARLLVSALPREPEPKGLLALLLHCEARRRARRDRAGHFVPLSQQDSRLWSRAMIVEAETLLVAASAAQRFGRFQCEAAIQSVHAQRARSGRLEHQALVTLYTLLLAHVPSVGARVGYAAALLEMGDAGAALDALAAVPVSEAARYQPYWVTRALALAVRGEEDGASQALERALELTSDQALRRHLGSLLQPSGF